MGVQVPEQVDKKALDAFEKAGLKDDILAMQTFDLKYPAQAVQAQEKLDALLPKMDKALYDVGINPFRQSLAAVEYKDPKSGDTLRSQEPHSGRSISVNQAIEGFNQQNTPSAPQVQRQAAPSVQKKSAP